MRIICSIFLYLFAFAFHYTLLAQDTTLVLDTTMFSPDQQIYLADAKGWVYHSGHDPTWTRPDLSTVGWLRRKPSDLSMKDADEAGRAEGWFRLRLRLDSTFKRMPVLFRKSGWAAADLYVDGRLLASFGSTGYNGKPYQEYFFSNQLATPVDLIPDKTYLIALHVVDYPHPIVSGKLRSEIGVALRATLRLVGTRYDTTVRELMRTVQLLYVFRLAVSLVVTLLLWLLFWQKLGLQEKAVIMLLAAQSSMVALNCLYSFIFLADNSYFTFIGELVTRMVDFVSVTLLLAILLRMVGHPWAGWSVILLVLIPVAAHGIDTWLFGTGVLSWLVVGLVVLAMFYVLITWRKRLQGAQWAIGIGLLLAFALAMGVVGADMVAGNTRLAFPYAAVLSFGYTVTIPLSFLVYVALRFNEILAEVRSSASAVMQITEEKRQLLADQNQRLEQQVEARTAELRASQAQLIQKEKLASLGELTAGIAHEIQNPLNFVNNYSEINVELIEELGEELGKGDLEEAQALLADLGDNQRKIHHHGRRADAIVRGMLEHARSTPGERVPTELNTLADEYLKLAYQGVRARDPEFQCEFITDLDPNLGQVEVVPSDIGRVLLNLYNNAFYAVRQRQQQAGEAYTPTVWVGTGRLADAIEIRVRDNGTGMPEEVKAKVFQPFFTTKPTGEGTGLGLSLSYDIITKGHGGTLAVESVEGQGTTFIIHLPK